MTLALPHTGMAVTTDIGEAKDIHPRNKQDVGKRLAAIALHDVYGKNIEFSGPVYQSMKVEGNNIRISFTHVGSGLLAKDKYGYLKGFEVAGSDQKFHYAKAWIEGNTVVVSSDQVSNPVAVHFAWADNPEDANLFNKDGFPAVPFRTDTWKGITDVQVDPRLWHQLAAFHLAKGFAVHVHRRIGQTVCDAGQQIVGPVRIRLLTDMKIGQGIAGHDGCLAHGGQRGGVGFHIRRHRLGRTFDAIPQRTFLR